MFTPLETAAITGFVSLLVALAVHVATKRNYVSHSQCKERHEGLCDDVKALQTAQESVRRDHVRRTDILFRMVRALVVHAKDVPDAEKTKILNETSGGE